MLCCPGGPPKKTETSNLLDSKPVVHLHAATVPVWLQVTVVAGWFALTATYFVNVEHFSWLEAFYLCACVITSVGYGDVVPVTQAGRLGMVVSVLFGFTAVVTCISMLVDHLSAKGKARKRAKAARKQEEDRIALAKCSLLWAVGVQFGVLALGTLYIAFAQSFSWSDSIYWSVITASSIGFGDLQLSSGSRGFGIFFLPLGVLSFGYTASALISLFLHFENEKRLRRFVASGVTPQLIAEIDQDKSGTVDKFEFVTYILLGQGKLHEEDLQAAVELFSKLDEDGSGTIDADDALRHQLNEQQQGTSSTSPLPGWVSSKA